MDAEIPAIVGQIWLIDTASDGVTIAAYAPESDLLATEVPQVGTDANLMTTGGMDTHTNVCIHSHELNQVFDYAPDVGGPGGSCTCQDGSVYQVGDNMDSCGSLACINGTPGACSPSFGEWSFRKVVCSLTKPKEYSNYCLDNAKIWELEIDHIDTTLTSISYLDFGPNEVYGFGVFTNPVRNVIMKNVAGVGTNGGLCVCPDGSKYPVGNLIAKGPCEFACIGGVSSGVCYKTADQDWDFKKVICDQNFEQKFLMRGVFDEVGMIFKGKMVLFNPDFMTDRFFIGALWKDTENVWIDGEWTNSKKERNTFRLKGPIANISHIPAIVNLDPANLINRSCICPIHKAFYEKLGNCIACHHTCKLCDDMAKTDCTQCYTVDHYQGTVKSIVHENRTCKIECAPNFYLKDYRCLPCSQACHKCSSESATDCDMYSCNSGYTWVISRCQQECLDYQYYHKSQETC